MQEILTKVPEIGIILSIPVILFFIAVVVRICVAILEMFD